MDANAAGPDERRPIRVLHVDDDPAISELTATFLERTDERFDVETTQRVRAGLDLLDDGEFDCIVSDYDMPGATGIEFLETVRADYPDLPFVLFTGKGSEAVASDAISAGVTDYLQKDGGTEQYALLANRIENVVGQGRAEQQAAATQRRLRELSETTNDILWIVSADWSEFLFVNSAYEDVWGRSREALVADPMDFLQGVHPDDRELATAKMAEASGGEPVDFELRVVPEADGQRSVWVQAEPVYDEGDDPVRIVGFVRDVTDRKRQARALQRQKAKIKALHDVATELKRCETANSVYELVVEAAESILEFDIAMVDEATEDVLVPKALSSDVSTEQYYSETPIEAEDNFAARAHRTGESSVVTDLRTHDVAPADTEFRSALTVPFGDCRVFQAVAETTEAFDGADLELAELLLSHAGSALDRIERERALERQNEQLDEFSSVVSHDLRNPLNVASAGLETVREECESEYLDDVAHAHDRMETLLDDLLTLAREGARVEAMELVEVGDMSHKCWETVATGGATLVTETERTVEADESRLKQLLENLFTNAVEHGDCDVTVTVGALEDSAGFYVADDGAGIPAEDRSAVFETGYSTAEDGTGLGLNIVGEIAEAHGWVVRLTESEDGGARFEITGAEDVRADDTRSSAN